MEENRNQKSNQELYEHYRLVADDGQRPLRVDKFLVNKIDASRNKIQNASSAGNILVNDKPVKPNHKIKAGDVVSIVMAQPPKEIKLTPENIPIDIVYEDKDLVIVNKRAGMVVHPAYGHYSGTLINALLHHLKDLPKTKEDEVRPGLVHRIDKNTSGLLVVAKNEVAMNNLAMQFFNKTTHREYVGMAWGRFNEKKGTIKGNIGRSLKNRKIMQVYPAGDRGKEAITHYEVLEDLGYVSLIKCWLETGRTHQIRVHMRYAGHPLFNDPEYGGNKILKGTLFNKYKQFVHNCFELIPRQALHAKNLGFIHPRTKEKMFFDSEIPEDIKKVTEKWRHYIANRE